MAMTLVWVDFLEEVNPDLLQEGSKKDGGRVFQASPF